MWSMPRLRESPSSARVAGKRSLCPDTASGAAVEHAAKRSELQQQLKENESQRTEITSYINQHSIQLHRWQLRLKTLNERQQKLQAELTSVGGAPTE